MRPVAAAAILILLADCTLVDQRTFQSAASAPGEAEVARVEASARPIVSVRMDTPDVDYRQNLADAVQAAQVRNPNASFDVLALVPNEAAPAEQDRRVAQAAQDAQAVAAAIGAAGVLSDRLHLGLRGDNGNPAREVRVFVR